MQHCVRGKSIFIILFTEVALLPLLLFVIVIRLLSSIPSLALFIFHYLFIFSLVILYHSHTRSAFVSIIVLSSLSHFSLCLFSLITLIAHTNPFIHPRNTLKSKYQQQIFVPLWFRCQQHALGLWVGSLRLFAVLGQQRTLLVHHAHIGTV